MEKRPMKDVLKAYQSGQTLRDREKKRRNKRMEPMKNIPVYRHKAPPMRWSMASWKHTRCPGWQALPVGMR